MPGFDTYTQLRQAEDVQDEIYIVSPVDTPVTSMSKSIRATGKLHEWTEDKLAAASSNKHIEGADAPADSSTPVTELNNNCQIMSKRAQITGTLETVEKYGRDSEMSYQLELRYAELANDHELAMIGAPGGTRQTGNAGSGVLAREMAAIQSQMAAGVIIDASGFTTVAQLEAGILDAHEATYNLGGNPSYLVCNPGNARYVANFAHAAGRQRDIENEKKLVNCIDLLVNPYGELDVILDRNTDDSMCLLDFNYIATPVLRTTHDFELARTGDSINRQIIREGTCALLNTESCACVDSVPPGLTLN